MKKTTTLLGATMLLVASVGFTTVPAIADMGAIYEVTQTITGDYEVGSDINLEMQVAGIDGEPGIDELRPFHAFLRTDLGAGSPAACPTSYDSASEFRNIADDAFPTGFAEGEPEATTANTYYIELSNLKAGSYAVFAGVENEFGMLLGYTCEAFDVLFPTHTTLEASATSVADEHEYVDFEVTVVTLDVESGPYIIDGIAGGIDLDSSSPETFADDMAAVMPTDTNDQFSLREPAVGFVYLFCDGVRVPGMFELDELGQVTVPLNDFKVGETVVTAEFIETDIALSSQSNPATVTRAVGPSVDQGLADTGAAGPEIALGAAALALLGGAIVLVRARRVTSKS